MSEFNNIQPGHFSVTGDLTFTNVPKVWEQARKLLVDVYEENVEIDIASVDKIDSSGIALFVAWSRWAHCNKKLLTFKNPNHRVNKLVEINKLESVINLTSAN